LGAALSLRLTALAADRTQARAMVISRYSTVATEQTLVWQIGASGSRKDEVAIP
jgi:hypothetical protein